jgi:hypothetical protein
VAHIEDERMKEQSNYQAFLLRIWREHETAPWRASLENPQLGKRLNFASMAELMAFLDRSTANLDSDSGKIYAKSCVTTQL